MKSYIAAFSFVASLAAFADVPDLTSSMAYLGNPAYSRWPSSGISRHVQDLVPHKGKIFTSGGEWGNNTGPCPCFAVDPYSGAYTNEFDAGTDTIYEFKEFSDGRLYTCAVDIHEGAAHEGSTFRRGSNDVWYAYNTACTACNITNFGNSAYQGYKIHNWDMAEWKGYQFVCGYGISGSTNWYTKAMFDVTPQLRSMTRKCDPVRVTYPSGTVYDYAYGYSLYRRFCAFLPFDDDIYCIPMQPVVWNDIQHWDWEEWRFNESTRKFVCQTNTWANIAPGITLEAASFTLPSNAMEKVQLWHPTKFGSRVLYIVGEHHYNIVPWAAYSAVNENHHVKATKIDLGGDDVKPFDICVADGAAYIVAAQAGMTATQVTNSVWKSTDGVSFTKLFTFVSTRQVSAICYYDGCFYLGIGSNACTKNGWPKVLGSDISGRIYRLRLPQGSAPVVVASTNAVAAAEGGSKSVAFRLAAKPATNMTLRVWSTDPRVVPSVATLSFTTSDWNTGKSVPFTVLEDDYSDEDYKCVVVCGTGAADCISAPVAVTVANNDFRVVETPPEGLVDITSPEGDWMTTIAVTDSTHYVYADSPFNDCEVNDSTNKTDRFLVRSTAVTVQYRFDAPTIVNAYGIVNYARANFSTDTRAPKAWTFEGSNDGATWTQLDIRRIENSWTAGEYRYYSFANETAYSFYRIVITANNGQEYTQFARMEMYGSTGPLEPAEPVDVTASLEYLGNPAYTRWPGSPMSRHVQDLFPYKGKIYTSGGEWDTNTGPCPIWAVDPYSGTYTNEFDAGTDAIYEFKEFTDGRLYTSAIDMHEGAANIGSTFRRGSNDVWYAYNTACTACNITNFGSSAYQGYRIHNWDMAEYKDYVFVCGYGISGSTNWCTTAMFDTTPQLRNIDRHCGPVSWTIPGRTYGATASDYQLLRRFCTFLPFDDDVYCFPDQPTFWDKITHFNWEEWRFNESTKKFVCQTNTWENIAPGITLEAASFTHPSNDAAQVQLWHPTKFGSRVLYIVGGHGDYGFNITPWAAYSAVNENHHVKATKIDIGGDDVKPFDICVANGTAYIVAAQAGMKATQVTNSVWKSSDGVSFTKIFTFVSTRQASAICYYDGCFYLGMGSNSFTKNGWPKVTGTDVSGRIYRVRLPQGSAPTVLASTNAVAVVEGGSGSVAFRLAAKPATNMTLRVWSTDPRMAPSVASLSFTTSNWSANQSVSFSVLEDDESDANFKGAIVCGTGAADCLSASVVVTVTNNDFRVIETPPEGLVDLTRPDGNFTTTVPAGVTLTFNKPFNDCDSNTNKEERLVAQATEFSVTYDFGTPTNVNAYGIVNFANSGYSPVERAPKAWTFEGSNNGTTWTRLDIRRFEKDWTLGEYRYYSFTNTANYSQYRISFTSNNGNAYTQFARLEYYHVGGQGGGDPDPEPLVSDFAKKTTFTPSSSALAKIGGSSWTNFPVLVRLPESVSSQLRSAGGTDLRVKDESGAELPFEVETFDPTGTTFVWVKVPTLSSNTVLTVFFSGAANANNDPTAVWSRYAGVWHFAPSAAGTMTVPDATGHGLDGTATNTLSAYAGPAGLGALQAGAVVRAPDYEAKLANVAKFSASGWFKAPTQVDSWWTPVSKKIGITTGPNGENLWNVDKGWYLQLPQVKNNLRLVYTSTAQMAIPDVTENWNYFQVVSDGSTLKVYLNGSSTASKSVSYTVKASGTPYQMCPKDGCSREYRVRIGAASAAETALEYATMADESFFAMGEIETIGVFVPAPTIGGEGVPAPAFGVDQSSGNTVFTFSIGNAVKGVKYRIYRTESLSEPFEPYGVAIEATVDGILDFAVPTADAPSCFFKIVTE